jgi:4-amino-4-deoxy-L-arabinose transferase-like glycosyltransferase
MAITKARYRLVLVLVLLLAYGLRLRTLDRSPLWFDEALEYWVATTPIEQLLPAVRDYLRGPPIYSVLLHFWMKAGHHEFVLRQISTLASLLTIVTVAALARRVYRHSAGLFAGLLLAILPPDIRFAQEVGQYTLMTLTLSLNLYALVCARESDEWKYWVAWVVTGLAAVYTYYGTLLVIGPAAGYVLIEAGIRRQGERLRRLIMAGGLIVLLALPILIFWLPDQFHWGAAGGTIAFSANPLPVEVANLGRGIYLVSAYHLTGRLVEPELFAVLRTIAALLILLMLLLSLISLIHSRKHGYIVVWLASSWMLTYLAGRLGAYPYGPGRHALILTPLLIASGAVGLAFLWRQQRFLAVGLVVAIAAVTLAAPEEPAEDLRPVVSQYLASRNAAAATYVYYGAVPAFRYQLQLQTGEGGRVRGVWYPDCWGRRPSPLCAEDGIHYGRWMRHLSAEEKYLEIMSTLDGAGAGEFWVIFSHTDDTERRELLDVLETRHELAAQIEAEGASAHLFRSR